mmetsp:Transcript_3009/g.10858  ORF Transcript_3009/g.10858 Transcript_3009/m.10858 type:complete len:137 (+) Transcript_3009:1539-1949(+)
MLQATFSARLLQALAANEIFALEIVVTPRIPIAVLLVWLGLLRSPYQNLRVLTRSVQCVTFSMHLDAIHPRKMGDKFLLPKPSVCAIHVHYAPAWVVEMIAAIGEPHLIGLVAFVADIGIIDQSIGGSGHVPQSEP